MTNKRTKIVCTLGPATSTPQMITKLIKAGMNVARLNFSHGTHEGQQKMLEAVRQSSAAAKARIAVIQDLQGPKIRLGKMPDGGFTIGKNQQVILSTAATKFTESPIPTLPVQYKHLHKDVKKGDVILIEDGMIELHVIRVAKQSIYCKTTNNCTFKSNKGINVPTASISADPLTAKDKKDLDFGLGLHVDFVALSFVRKAADIEKLRKIITKRGSKAKIIAKIERHEAIKDIEEIVKATDAVMVARGDLGVEIPAELVPIAQKKIIATANRYGKPVIIATEVLQSMIDNPRATRAEISDAANGVYDHTDALMLSNETAVGKYPIKAVQTLAKVSKSIEDEQRRQRELEAHLFQNHKIADQISQNAAELADDINAKYIVTLTNTGYTPTHIAKTRVQSEIITFATKERVCRQLALVWGLSKKYVRKFNPRRHVDQVIEELRKEKLVKTGDVIVIVANDGTIRRSITVAKV